MIDKNPAHGLGRHGKEMRPALPIDGRLIHELHVGLVHQRRRLKVFPFGSRRKNCPARFRNS